MAFATTRPLREEVARALPERPFALRFWDGTSVPATGNGASPTFWFRSPRAIAHVLRAPGELGLGRACGLTLPPWWPAGEPRLPGQRHSVERDARAVRHHYDVPTELFELFLDGSMTYSCAIFSRGARTLEEAQAAKLELVCSKLALEPGERVLDIG